MPFRVARGALRKSDVLMPVNQDGERYDNLETGLLTKPKVARKDFLAHAQNKKELMAARYVWNHPEVMQQAGISPLGEGKDPVKDAAQIAEKQRKGIIQYNKYTFSYRGEDYLVKTARYRNGHETLYHIENNASIRRTGH